MRATMPLASAESSAPCRRIVVIDDSVVARVMLSQAFDGAGDFEVCATFGSAVCALDWLATNACDLILLDLEMPGRSGLAALPDLIAASGVARIVVVSSIAAEGAAATLQALSLGAADVIAKPAAGPIGRQFGIDLIARLRSLATESTVVRERPAALAMREAPETAIECVAIGASTGGIHALARFLSAIPRDFDAPILVTQHLPAPFMPFFADQIATIAGRPCRIARDGERITRHALLIAPGDGHLAVARTREGVVATIMRHPVTSRCLPSVDPMFASVGEVFGTGGVGVVLSGMGRDGSEGAKRLADAGGTILAQDCETATIWGMPGSVARAGLASLVATPERIAEHLAWRGSAS